MLLRTVLTVLLLAPVSALAEDTPEIREVTAPEKGSPEEAVRESILLLMDGKADEWIKTWCTPARCQNKRQTDDLKKYMLKQAQLKSKNCLHGDDKALHISETKGNPDTDSKMSIRLKCSHTQFPPPAVLEKVDGKWYVTSIPW